MERGRRRPRSSPGPDRTGALTGSRATCGAESRGARPPWRWGIGGMGDGSVSMSRKLLAELLGTFWLVFGGCGSAVLAAGFPELGIGFAGVALAFGLTVVTMAYAVGHISGGHFTTQPSPSACGRAAGSRHLTSCPIGSLRLSVRSVPRRSFTSSLSGMPISPSRRASPPTAMARIRPAVTPSPPPLLPKSC